MALGIWLTGFLPILPGATPSLLYPLGAALAAVAIRNRRIALPLALVAGATYTDYRATALLDTLLPDVLDHQVVTVRGEVAGLPRSRDIGGKPQYRFDLVDAVVSCSTGTSPCAAVLPRLRLSWRMTTPVVLTPGQVWSFEVKLRRPRGYVNPAGFRYGDWLVQQGYAATGYVRGKAQLLGATRPHHRSRLQQSLLNAASELPNLRFMQALALADRSALTRADWQRFADTGTSHLLAISGLHIGIAAGVGGLLGGLLARLFILRGTLIGLSTALPALVIAAGYSSLAGWALPTQRAFVMVAAATVAICARRQIGALPGYTLALMAVLLVDPLAGFGVGFYLSFGAVAILLLAGRGRRYRDPLQLRPQWAIAIGMMPLLLVAFGSLPSATLIANLVSIPLYSLLIVPLLLAAIVLLEWFPGLAGTLLGGVDTLLGWQQAYLGWLDFIAPVTVPEVPRLLIAGMAVAVLCFVMPRVIPGRAAALVVLCIAVLVSRAPPSYGPSMRVTVLDVGQGLSILVQQGAATMVYDVGPAYGPDFDTGTAFLLPLLQGRGIDAIGTLVVSHNDNDHAGALPRIFDDLDPAIIRSGEPLGDRVPHTRCQSGQRFELGRAVVEMLHPSALHDREGNNASCVLRLRFAGNVILLPGDIEKPIERALLARERNLRADVIVAPHHGSKTSSSPDFVNALGARHVIFSAGWRHHFGHPHPDVVARWCRRGGRIWSTAAQGAIVIEIRADGSLRIGAERARRTRFWHRSHPFRCV